MNRFEIFNMYLAIKQELITDLVDVFNRQVYFTKRYRGDIKTDVNVGIGRDEDTGNKMIQIFIRHNGMYIKENIVFNFKGLYTTTIKSNLHE
ncbi:MAG: hypothetical protein KUG81_09000 [Gammaproteobacteria bacterium]|nr:hypothetical protein [Gammaproteobacteria bacterium]